MQATKDACKAIQRQLDVLVEENKMDGNDALKLQEALENIIRIGNKNAVREWGNLEQYSNQRRKAE